jgi:hypothetical protein
MVSDSPSRTLAGAVKGRWPSAFGALRAPAAGIFLLLSDGRRMLIVFGG